MSAPATAWRSTLAQTGMELRLTARRGENVLVIIVLPVVVLLFFASTSIVPVTAGRPVDFLLPGVLALAVISTSLVNLGIATAYERYYGVLKLLGGSPLPRAGLIGAKMLAVLVVEIVQFAVLFAVALAFLGWRPPAGSGTALVVVGLLLGTLAFAGIGLAMAGSLRAEATLAGANGLFLALLLLGGIVVPLDQLPAAVAGDGARSSVYAGRQAAAGERALGSVADRPRELGRRLHATTRAPGRLGDRSLRSRHPHVPLGIVRRRTNPGWSGPGVQVYTNWLRGKDSNLRPSGYEPDELPLLHPATSNATGMSHRPSNARDHDELRWRLRSHEARPALAGLHARFRRQWATRHPRPVATRTTDGLKAGRA